jgi:hypothetical protein
VSAIGANRPILRNGAPELAHGEDGDVGHALADVLGESGEIREQAAQLTRASRLIDMRIPATHVGEGNLQSESCLDELSDL